MRRYRTRLGLQFGKESIAARRLNVGIIDFLILLSVRRPLMLGGHGPLLGRWLTFVCRIAYRTGVNRLAPVTRTA